MENKDISTVVRGIINSSKSDNIEFVEGSEDIRPILFNQRETIRRINFYLNDKFLEREDGIFWNIINHRITHFGKLISPDTKDFYPYGLGEMNFWQAWALRKKVREWFDDNAFYQILNDLAEGLSTYGSVVWKKHKVKGKTIIKEVRLENLYFDQRAEFIKDTDVVEIHQLSRKEMWDYADVWDGVEEFLNKHKEEKDFQVWEFTGFYAEEGKPQLIKRIGFGEGEGKTIFWEEDLDETPYVDFHIGIYKGRWLRIGVSERLFSLQERVNQLVNQNAIAGDIASLLLLRTNNPDAVGNVLTSAINGQIIPDSTLEQIGIQNPGLSQFIQEMNLINLQADRICLTPEIIQGESSPSNTTFRGLAVVNAGAVTAFKNYRQNIFERISELLMTDIFPTLVKDWKKTEVIEMAEDEADVEEYDKNLASRMEIEAILNGQVVDNQVAEQIRTTISDNIKNVGRRIRPDENFWNFKWGFKMMATDESVDKAAKNDTYFNSLQMTAANPAITDVPGFKQYLEDNGISPWKLTPKQQQAVQEGGSMNSLEQKQPDKLLAQAKQLS